MSDVSRDDLLAGTDPRSIVDTMPVNIAAALGRFEEKWSPRVLATVNDYAVKVVKVEGEFVWHSHPDTDELFIVLDGELEIRLRTGLDGEWAVHLGRGDAYVVPIGIEHCPRSVAGASLLLLEPAGTVNTGDHLGTVPDHIDVTQGHGLP